MKRVRGDAGGRRSAWAAAVALVPLLSALPAHAGARQGAVVFQQNCAQCHSVRRGEVLAGPSLAGVVGRPSASTPGFAYSAAMKAANVKWTPATLDTFITQPRRMIHGILMTSPGVPDAAQRADLIAYLATLK